MTDLLAAVNGVGRGRSLEIEVGLALAAARTGHPALASALLLPFTVHVRAQAGRTIPKATADQLLADAQRIRAVLG